MSDRLRALWSGASPRERGMLALGALVVAGAIVYALWQPVQRDLVADRRALAELEARATSARRTADEIAGLAREVRAPRTPDARAAVERVVDAQGLRSALTAVDTQSERVRLTFAAVDFAALTGLLDRLAREEQLFPVEAMLAAHATRGTVRAELSLARPPAR